MFEYEYISDATLKKVREIIQAFSENEESPDDLVESLKKALPVHYTDEHAWKKRLEGFFEASELFVVKIVEVTESDLKGSWSREKILAEAKIRPLRYFHHVTGFGESTSIEPVKYDYFSNSSEALIKLEDDIYSLAEIFRKITKVEE